jgi:hypothetical protein
MRYVTFYGVTMWGSLVIQARRPGYIQYGTRYIMHESGQHFGAREGRAGLGPPVTVRMACFYHLHP